MALTCKVQYLDDTDPFASTNFPEPTRPPTYTFHLNIPLCQQIAGLHRLLCAPHNIDDVALQLSHNGCYLDLESALEEQADLLEGFLDSRKNTIILRTSLSVRVHNCIAKLLAASGRELRRALFSLKQIFQDDKDLVHEFVNSDGLNALISVGQDADQNYQNYILRAIGQIMLYVDGMNGVINHSETLQWLYSLTASRFRLVGKTALKLLLVFVEYTESNSRVLYEAVQVVDGAQGVKDWAEIIGILTDKESLTDEEILIYAVTLINKVLYATPSQDAFYDITDALEEQGMEQIVKMHQNRSNIDLLEQLNIYETALKIEDGDEEIPAFGGSPSIRQRKRTVTDKTVDRRRSRRHNSVSKIDISTVRRGKFLTPPGTNSREGSMHKVASAPNVGAAIKVEHPSTPVKSSGSSTPSASTNDELDEKAKSRQARKERRAARRAALSIADTESEEPPASKNERSRSRHSNRDEGNSRGHLEVTSPVTDRPISPRSSPRASPRSSPLLPRRKFKFDEPQAKESVNYRSRGSRDSRVNEDSGRQQNVVSPIHKTEMIGQQPEQTSPRRKEMNVTTTSRKKTPEKPKEHEKSLVNDINHNESSKHRTGDHNGTSDHRTSDEGDDTDDKLGSSNDDIISDTSENTGQVEEKPKSSSPQGRRTSTVTFPNEGRRPSVVDSESKRSSICEGFPGATNKKMMLSMLYGQQRSTDDLERKLSDAAYFGDSVQDRKQHLLSSSDSDDPAQRQKDVLTVDNLVSDSVKRLSGCMEVDEENEVSTNAPEGEFEGLIQKAKSSLMNKPEKTDQEAEEEARKQEELRKKQEEERRIMEEEAARKAAEEAAVLQELEWERMITLKRSLIVKDFDFTDLADDEDDVLSSRSCEETDAPPLGGVPMFGMPPPPPPFPGGAPAPPPPPGGPAPPPPPPGPPKPPPLNGVNPKKKLVRLFWQEVKNSPLINGVNKTIWGSIDSVDIDTKKLEHLFENKSVAKIKKTEGDDKEKKREIVVLEVKRSQAINIGLTKLPPVRTLKQAILNMDSTVIDREGIDKLLLLQPTPEEKTKIQEAQMSNPDIPLGTAEQFLLTMSSINELTPRLNLWSFKLDYDVLEREVAEPLMDLKEAIAEISENETFKHILATLLAIGNFLNGKTVKGFQLDYLAKVPEVKDTVHKQSLLYHLCCMVMEKFPNTSDLYSDLGALHRSSRVDFDIVHDSLKKLRENCKRSWEHLSVVAKHDSTKQLKSKMSEFLADAQERSTILKVVHRRVLNRFRKMLLYLGLQSSVANKTKVHEFCKIISEFSLEYRTTRERVIQQKKKRENMRERSKTRGKLITESFPAASKMTTEDNIEAFRKALTSNGDDMENAREKLKSATLPGTRNRVRVPGPTRSNSGSQAPDDCTDDNTDEVMDMLAKNATVPNSRTRVRKRAATKKDRKSVRRTLKSGISPEDMEKLTKQVNILDNK